MPVKGGTHDRDVHGKPCTFAPARCARPRVDWRSPPRTARSPIRGDRDDVFSKGFICPKGSTLKQLHADPDRVSHPVDQARRAVRGGHLGRSVRSGRRRTATGVGPPRPRQVGHLPGQPHRPLGGGRHLRRTAHQVAPHQERVLGVHGGPDAQARDQRLPVRQRQRHPRARSRPHRLPG